MRGFVKVNEVKEGTILIPDNGFTCVREGREITIEKNKDGKLFFTCKEGEHLLTPQLNETKTHYHGLYLKD